MKKPDYAALILRMESYLECWKQLHHFMVMARQKKYTQDDENQFLEIKSVLVQELEQILASVEVPSPTREEIHALITEAPSLRYISEINDGALRNQESQWHKVYIGWHSILGQLKVRQRGEGSRSAIGAVFGKKK
jgi:hypothetical protein